MDCKVCGKTFEITKEDLSLLKKFDEKPQGLCFECAQKRHLYFRNERSLYRRKCDTTGEEIISIYSPDKPYKVYKSDQWYSDIWDPLNYGRDFDFGRTFTEQFKKLQIAVPRPALSNMRGVNSEYCNMTFGNKNCYLIFGGDFNEDCMYGILCMENRNVVECDYSNYCELCYEISDCIHCYNLNFAMDCKECTDCNYISDCIGCRECILCTNLINQSYCIENKKLSKGKYLARKKEILENCKKAYEKFLEIRRKRVVKFAHQVNCENCTGDYLKNCKNCANCFDMSECEDMKDIIYASPKCKDCYNCSLLGHGSEVCYDMQSTIGSFNCKHSYFLADSHDIEYSEFCTNSSSIFGCIGLRHKHHCIFNKQYSKEDYKKLRARIITHMKETNEYGQFLHPELSCFGYNETTAYYYYPLSKEQALKEGFGWKS